MPTTPSSFAPPPQRTCQQKLQQLVAAIRDPATTMDDLTHMVGPDSVEAEKHVARMRIIDSLWEQSERLDNRWGSDPGLWPSPERERYQTLSASSKDFENRYC
jgi:hypothetical protein